ncbi:hypothetical protein [Neobacillus sp. Marseille-QA0830]
MKARGLQSFSGIYFPCKSNPVVISAAWIPGVPTSVNKSRKMIHVQEGKYGIGQLNESNDW